MFVRIEAASYCVALQQDVEIAERLLEEISSDHNYGILRFNAEMTLKVWREKGELQLYQKSGNITNRYISHTQSM